MSEACFCNTTCIVVLALEFFIQLKASGFCRKDQDKLGTVVASGLSRARVGFGIQSADLSESRVAISPTVASPNFVCHLQFGWIDFKN